MSIESAYLTEMLTRGWEKRQSTMSDAEFPCDGCDRRIVVGSWVVEAPGGDVYHHRPEPSHAVSGSSEPTPSLPPTCAEQRAHSEAERDAYNRSQP